MVWLKSVNFNGICSMGGWDWQGSIEESCIITVQDFILITVPLIWAQQDYSYKVSRDTEHLSQHSLWGWILFTLNILMWLLCMERLVSSCKDKLDRSQPNRLMTISSLSSIGIYFIGTQFYCLRSCGQDTSSCAGSNSATAHGRTASFWKACQGFGRKTQQSLAPQPLVYSWVLPFT